jgi:hypothetical protein
VGQPDRGIATLAISRPPTTPLLPRKNLPGTLRGAGSLSTPARPVGGSSGQRLRPKPAER